ncbi:ADP-ribose diphosphatase [Shewanella sp. Scap07]|uniref:ADP-ribose diphosphatase n=1 Tax=Shewanella sp. Scap07 TaxID=2589987 RepID=UPI0015C175A6|nr:ADP-ribose diphosphatase [Shewanella sp. Scap07]
MQNKFSSQDVEMLERKRLYQGFFTMEEYRFRHRLFDGGWSDVVHREVFERGHAVVVLAYDPYTDQVVLIEQIRIPVFDANQTPWLFELVAGMIDKGQTAKEVAQRELMEESGLTGSHFQLISEFFASPGGTSEKFSLYYAEVDASQASGTHGLAEEHEDIQVHVVSREAAFDMVKNGLINNASTVIGLQWLQLNYQSLVKK